MSRRLAMAVVLVASGVHALAQGDAAQRSFGGDAVHLDLSVGDYRVTASSDNRIRVTPRTKTERVSTRIDVNLWGTRADVRVVGPNEGFTADIQVPARVGVVIALAGGSLQLGGVGGVRSFEWTGTGADDLRMRVKTGRVTLKK